MKDVRAQVCVCVCVYVCIHIHTYIHTYTHTRAYFILKSILRYFICIFFTSKPMHEISTIALFEIYIAGALTTRVDYLPPINYFVERRCCSLLLNRCTQSSAKVSRSVSCSVFFLLFRARARTASKQARNNKKKTEQDTRSVSCDVYFLMVRTCHSRTVILLLIYCHKLSECLSKFDTFLVTI